jgi:tRNA-2-methylthio-N6-dimethylallyladenosine synthase
VVSGQRSLPLSEKKRYREVYDEIYQAAVASPVMKKYHDLGTPENVRREVRERLQILQALQTEHTLQKNRESIGRLESIIAECPSKHGNMDMTGRTRGNRIVNFRGNIGLIGKTVSVRITEAFLHSLRGVIEERREAYVH